ncbi:putative transcriptional regulator, AraC family protein [Mesorhizobium metallidurans STM 2683]|uniref:Putative transcriptional regulator, AraC family protein n=1 Tax=Mesorhizobium metallidurans STM 2683 TaxID=1297569 RepID=M5ESX2_9HYPH|nr:AraC family transcriptional regulator [Mesorhizobium metallidurans]CCV07342.1 putative transcriptional regulator, AraC family protein [Mesorhizobium metallidurans STM 2683]
MDSLKQAAQAYASRHANGDGVAITPVPGLMLKCVESPGGDLHAISRPLFCLVLQGAKRMIVGREERVFSAGQSVIVSADMPVVSRVLQASRSEPYLAIAVELEMTVLREVASQMGSVRANHTSEARTLFAENTDVAVLDCASRLMRLLNRPEATSLIRPAIMLELHYWLLSGQHGVALRTLADSDGHASRLAKSIAILRAEYRSRISIDRLAAAAGMSLTSFHKNFKHMTSLTPGQYQKRFRLIEARRLMLDEGFSASSAAFEVGYESVSQFTREYGRLFRAPPKRYALRARSESSSHSNIKSLLPI